MKLKINNSIFYFSRHALCRKYERKISIKTCIYIIKRGNVVNGKQKGTKIYRYGNYRMVVSSDLDYNYNTIVTVMKTRKNYHRDEKENFYEDNGFGKFMGRKYRSKY